MNGEDAEAGIVGRTTEHHNNPGIHVAIVRKKYRGKVYEHAFLRQSYREGGKVQKRTLGTLKGLPRPMVDQLRRILRGETLVPVSGAFEIQRSLPHGHVAAVLGTARRLGLERLLDPRPSRQRNLVMSMVVARILMPSSKLATARSLQEETQFTSLGEVIQVSDVEEDDLYAALDWLREQQSRIERKLVKRHLTEGSLVLYDLTSTAYTGNHCPLAEFGFPPQGRGRRRYRQIRFGLVCSREGIPVAVEVFKGNAVDSETLSSQLEKLQKRYGVRRVVMVGDRGILTEATLREDVAPEGLGWIAALRAPAIRALLEAGTVQMSLFDQKDLAEITSADYPGERLIACRNPFLAEERAQKREELLRATEKELDRIVAATQRVRRPLRGEAQIGLRVGAVVNKHRVAKHFQLHISDKEFRYERDTESIAAEVALDGIYVIRSNVPAEEMAAEETVRAYKGLAVVERAFRSLKSVDLKVSPIFHRLDIRVEAHVFLCMLAYYVEWHMRQALAPILFDDDNREAAQNQRRSVVAPAERSPQAQCKAQTKRTTQGEPVHSFQTLLRDLATIAKNTVVFNNNYLDSGEAPTFARITVPTLLQQRAFDLLGIALK
jgi:transposase